MNQSPKNVAVHLFDHCLASIVEYFNDWCVGCYELLRAFCEIEPPFLYEKPSVKLFAVSD